MNNGRVENHEYPFSSLQKNMLMTFFSELNPWIAFSNVNVINESEDTIPLTIDERRVSPVLNRKKISRKIRNESLK